MKIKEVCERTALTDRAIRFYIESGLVFPSSSENYSGRKSFSFSQSDVERLQQIAGLRKAGFTIEQIRLLLQEVDVRQTAAARLEAISSEQTNQRAIATALSQVIDQQELTLQSLLDALHNATQPGDVPANDNDPPFQVLLRKAKRAIAVLCVVIVLFIGAAVALFLVLGGADAIRNRMNVGRAWLTVSENHQCLPAEAYTLNKSDAVDGTDGYSFGIDYGEVRDTIRVDDALEIEFGFINTNNWHTVHIHLDIDRYDESMTVRQTISYLSDNKRIDVLVSEQKVDKFQTKVCVFRDGL